MKSTMFRRILTSALALVMFSSSLSLAAFADEESSNNTNLSESALPDAASVRQKSYSNYLEEHQNDPKPDRTFEITSADFLGASDGAQAELANVDGKDNVLLWSNQTGAVSYKVVVPETGMYNIKAVYEALAGNTNEVEFSLLIDGESPYATATRITLDKQWINQTDIKQDSRGNDMRPSQVENVCWQETPIKDVDGLFNEPLYFYFKEGEHKITLSSEKAQFALEKLSFYQYKEAEGYKAPSSEEMNKTNGQRITLEGETANFKSSRSLYPTADKSSYVTSSVNGASPTKTRYNTIGGGGWSQSGQTVTWEFDVPADGTYKIGIRAKQNSMRGMYSNRRLYIDGQVPCKEAGQIKFYYDTDWSVTSPKDGNGNDLYFYLEKGKHTLALEAIPGEIGEIMGDLDEIVYNINSYYRQIRQITGPDPDEYNNYGIDTAIPTILDDFTLYAKQLRDKKAEIEKLSGSGGTEAETLEKMAIVLDKCIKKPDIIPEMMQQIKDNITSVSSFINQYREQPLELDLIELTTQDVDFTDCEGTFFDSFSFGFKGFMGSFFEDYNTLSDVSGESMECWITLGRDNATAAKELIDSDYNPNAKTKISLKLVQGGIVEATFAGKGPDLALFLGGDFPIQLASRGVLTDISKKDDYQDVIKRYSKNAMTLYEYNGGAYGLPCDQRFPMLFYRTDVLAQYGIDPDKDLDTWEDLINCLPTLQRNYLEVGLVLPIIQNVNGQTYVSAITETGNTFAMMLLQKGLNYYTDDLSKTTFDQPDAIDAFDDWTKFYTTYSFDQTYDAFSRFRTGDMPVLIKDYAFYNQLSVAAPEIKGCWGFRTVPGTKQADGTVSHAANSEGSAAVIFKKASDQDGAWDFLKWFTSTDAQVKYGNNLESILGQMGRYQTANVEALEQLSWTTAEVTKLEDQLNSQIEIPIIPASYGVTRNVVNAFRAVANDYENARDTLFWYNKDINEEIQRKRDDMSLYDDD